MARVPACLCCVLPRSTYQPSPLSVLHIALPLTAPQVDLAEVDVMLVTHFHLDHCAAVPYVTGHTPFRGRVLMTHATKAIVHTLLKDFVKVSRGGSGGWQARAGWGRRGTGLRKGQSCANKRGGGRGAAQGRSV